MSTRRAAPCQSWIRVSAALRNQWRQRRGVLLKAVVSLMVIASAVWLGYQFWRLLWASAPIWPGSVRGAMDLGFRWREVQAWFRGEPVYRRIGSAVYPPASYVLLWPLVGWLEFTPARVLWALTTVVALAWLIRIVLRESGAQTRLERAFVALLPLAMYATGAAIGNGQMVVHLLVALLAGLLLFRRAHQHPSQLLLAACLVVFGLVKPTVSAPFFWILLFGNRSLKPALVTGATYFALTCFAARLQSQSVVGVTWAWLRTAFPRVSSKGNLSAHRLLPGALFADARMAQVLEWALPLAVLVALGLLFYLNRRANLWTLMSMSAIVSRFWTYRRWFDDVVMLLPMIALFRIARSGPRDDGQDVLAAVLLALTWASTLAPGGTYLFPEPWNEAYGVAQLGLWGVLLIYFALRARRQHRRAQLLLKHLSEEAAFTCN